MDKRTIWPTKEHLSNSNFDTINSGYDVSTRFQNNVYGDEYSYIGSRYASSNYPGVPSDPPNRKQPLWFLPNTTYLLIRLIQPNKISEKINVIIIDNKSNNNGDHIDNEQTFNNLFLPYYKQVIQFGFYIHNISLC